MSLLRHEANGPPFASGQSGLGVQGAGEAGEEGEEEKGEGREAGRSGEEEEVDSVESKETAFQSECFCRCWYFFFQGHQILTRSV